MRASWRLERTPPARVPELMDAPDCDRDDLARALEVLGRVARRTGGDRLLRRQLDLLLADRRPGRLRLLDIGTGGGHTALAVDDHLRARGWAPSFVLADLHAQTLELCRRRVGGRHGADRFRYVRLDGARLPLATRSVDIAFSTMTLHHLEDREAAAFVSELGRVSRLGWALVDLRRSRLVQAAIGVLAVTAWRSAPLPRVDGPISVRRSFTPSEVRRLLDETGLGSGAVVSRILRWAARGSA